MTKAFSIRTLSADAIAGMVVFLVALPLCLGVAFASAGRDHLFAGIVSGIIGGIVVGAISKSHTSVSGLSPALTTIVAVQIATLGSFEALLLAVFFAGIIQIGMGIARVGFLSAFFPSSAIKGLLVAVGIILILKQTPHFFGHDTDPEGEMSFFQPDKENTFSELLEIAPDFHYGATLVGIASLIILLGWDRVKILKKCMIPSQLVVVVLGVALHELLSTWGGKWMIGATHLVQVPVSESLAGLQSQVIFPDISQVLNPGIYLAAVTIALVASLETLMNLEAVDKIDPLQRHSPPNRELIAQGVGNAVCGLIGGLPLSSVIVRSSVGINAGGKTRMTTIIHGILLLGSVALLPTWLNRIPLSCLAAILIVTGGKLIYSTKVEKIWREGWYQFIPFAATVVAIVFTDLLTGVLIGLAICLGFILNSNLRRPLRRILERHPGGDVLRIEFANQVSFLNRAVLSDTLENVKPGGNVLLDARYTDYIDPDVVDLIRQFQEHTAPARNVSVSMIGFKDRYDMRDTLEFVDHFDRDLQSKLTPLQVIRILQEGNSRFRLGQRLTRDIPRSIETTCKGQFPMAVVLSCIDSRAPAELIFDAGLGDIFSARVAGNLTTSRVLGSIEYGCAVAGSKLVLVMGHTRCGAVSAAVDLMLQGKTALETTGCENLDAVVLEIQKSINSAALKQYPDWTEDEKNAFLDDVIRRNVLRTMDNIRQESPTLNRLDEEGQIKIVGGIYDVTTGEMRFLDRRGVVRAGSVAESSVVV